MNNKDIIILKDIVNEYKDYFCGNYNIINDMGLKLAHIEAIENLIKGYKDLEEKNIKLQKRNNRQFKLLRKRDKEIENLRNTNKTLYELCQGKAMQEFINNECDYIPKSKVRKKIEQIKMNANYDWLYKYDYQDVTKILEELLQEGDDK